MFRKIILFVIFSITLLQAKDYIDIYRHKGIQEVKKLFDKELQKESYWDNYLKDFNITYGYYETERYIVIVGKKDKILNLFYTDGNGSIDKIFTKDIITGKNGEKKKEGDLITPLGVYKIVKRFKPKNSFYGPVAFALSYPNLLDELNGRGGHGIWIHGYPLDHKKRPPVTKGCMVLQNDQLLDFNSTIDPNKSTIIIYEEKMPSIDKNTYAKILAFLYSWRSYWKYNDIDRYLSCYAKDFKRYDGKNLTEFSRYKNTIFSRNEKKKITFEDISITPYPNLKNEKLFLVSFYEIYKTNHYRYNGFKKLYIRFDKEAKIIVEK